jgi:hypothetical protein
MGRETALSGGLGLGRLFALKLDRETAVHFEFNPRGRSLAIGMVQGDSVSPLRTVFENLPDPMFVTSHLTVQQPATGPGLPPAVELTIESEDE